MSLVGYWVGGGVGGGGGKGRSPERMSVQHGREWRRRCCLAARRVVFAIRE